MGSHAKVAIVSDTHGVLDPRIADVVAACDFAVHAGDIGSLQVLEALRPRRLVVAVRGNNDVPAKWPAGERDGLARLPFEQTLDLPGGRLHVVHGDRVAGARDVHARLRRMYPAVRAIVYGHSHRMVCDCTQEPWVLNPGAAGRQRTYGGPSCLVLCAAGEHWHVEVCRFAPLPPAKRPHARNTAPDV